MKAGRGIAACGIVSLVLAMGCSSSSGNGAGGDGGTPDAIGPGNDGSSNADGNTPDGGGPADGHPGGDAKSDSPTPPPDGGMPGHAIKTVFIIVMENNNWSTIKGSSSAPYINGTLLAMGAHAEAYNNVTGIHPSEPNYLWLVAGTNFGILDDSDPSSNHQSSTAHLANQLSAANVTWKAWEEDISGTDCPLVSVGKYAPKHDPFVYFDDITNTNDSMAATCIAHVRPYTELQAALTGTAPQYNFITPNLCDDMHDSCAPLNDGIKQGDTWLSTEVPKIMASPAYTNGGAIFITWDESEGGDFPIGMIVLSPLIKSGGYQNMIPYSHSSTLRTMQEIFGVSPFLGDAANAMDLSDFFTSFP